MPNRFVIAESCLRTLLVFWNEISSALPESCASNRLGAGFHLSCDQLIIFSHRWVYRVLIEIIESVAIRYRNLIKRVKYTLHYLNNKKCFFIIFFI